MEKVETPPFHCDHKTDCICKAFKKAENIATAKSELLLLMNHVTCGEYGRKNRAELISKLKAIYLKLS